MFGARLLILFCNSCRSGLGYTFVDGFMRNACLRWETFTLRMRFHKLNVHQKDLNLVGYECIGTQYQAASKMTLMELGTLVGLTLNTMSKLLTSLAFCSQRKVV